MSPSEQTSSRNESAYICFSLGRNLFGLDVSHVREVLDYQEILPLPMAPHFLLGLVDLRGVPVPVIDLRVKFGLSPVEVTLQTRILILELRLNERDYLIGAMADKVQELIEASPADISPPPALGLSWQSDVFQGVTHSAGQTILLVEVSKIIGLEDIQRTNETILKAAGGICS